MSTVPSNSRSSRNETPHWICMKGLPKGYTWQDLKDLIRPLGATHGIWSDIRPHDETSEMGLVKLQRHEEAERLYKYLSGNLVENRQLEVHLWDITTQPPTLRAYSGRPSHLPSPTSPDFSLPNSPTMARTSPYIFQSTSAYSTSPGRTYAAAPMQTGMPPSQANLVQAMGAMQIQSQQQAYPYWPSNPQQTQDPYQAQGSYQIQLPYPAQVPYQTQYQYQPSPGPQQPLPLQPLQPQYASTASNLVNTRGGYAVLDTKGIFVGGLAFSASERKIRELFSQVGDVKKVTLHKDSASKSKGNATIYFASAEEAERAIRRFNNVTWIGRTLRVRADKEAPPTGPPVKAKPTTNRPGKKNPNDPLIVDGSSSKGGTKK